MPFNNNQTNIELCSSSFSRDIFKEMHRLGYKIIPEVNIGAYTISLVIEGDNDKRLAIILDGDKYQTAENWLKNWNQQMVLERVGWSFWRCWASEYIIDSQNSIKDLIDRLNYLEIYPSKNNKVNNIYVEHRSL